MFKAIFFAFFCIITTNLSAQQNFIDAVITRPDGTTEAIQLLDKDWRNPPRFIEYRTSDGAPLKKVSTSGLAALQIGNEVKFKALRAQANLFPNRLRVPLEEKPDLGTVQNFLVRVDVEGTYSLYTYMAGNTQHFFLQVRDQEPLQLRYVRHLDENHLSTITDRSYIYQLNENLDCGLGQKDYADLGYTMREIKNLIVKCNKARGEDFIVYERKRPRQLHVGLMAGAFFHSIAVENSQYGSRDVDFGSATAARFGARLVFDLPYRDGAFSVSFSPNYYTFSSKGKTTPINPDLAVEKEATIDLTVVDLPIGVRYTALPGKQVRPYVEAFGGYAFFMNDSSLRYEGTTPIRPQQFLAYGGLVGAQFMDHLFVEVRLQSGSTFIDFALSKAKDRGVWIAGGYLF